MNIIDHLQRIPIFAKVKPETLEMLAGIAKSEAYYATQDIVQQGDLAKRFFIVDLGVINLRETTIDGMEQSVGIVTNMRLPGLTGRVTNYFGEQMFTSQEPYEYHATAVDEVQVYAFERGDFDALILEHPEILDELAFIKKAEAERTHGYDWVVEGERVIVVVHKHWWVLLPGLAQVAIAAIIVLVANLALGFFGLTAFSIVGIVAWIVPILLIGYKVYDWHNDDYIVTNQRVGHFERVFVTAELRESIPIDKIVATVIDTEIPRSYFGVSTLIIQSGGRGEGNVTFSDISNAKEISKAIQTQQDRLAARMAAKQRERDRGRIQQVLREYMLPHVVAQERAAEAAVRANLPPPKPPTFIQKLRNSFSGLFNMEFRRGSVVTWRKHWIVLLREGGRWALGFVGVIVGMIFAIVTPGFPLPFGGVLLAGLVLLLICLVGFGYHWLDWRNDTYAVTDTQLVDAERKPLGPEKTTTAQLDQVQDVKVSVPSLVAQILNYGDVKIETAGQGGAMIFYSIHNPRSASDEIYRRLDEYRRRKEERESRMRNRGVIDALIGYDRLRKEEARWLEQAKSQQPPGDENARDWSDGSSDEDHDDGDQSDEASQGSLG